MYTLKDIEATVTITSINGLITAKKWPPKLSLTTSKETAASPQVLREFSERHSSGILIIQPSRVIHPKNNERNLHNLKSLHRLLAERGLYALAGWPEGSGGPEGRQRILIFCFEGTLAGAYFPGGVPKLPAGPPPPPPSGNIELSDPRVQALIAKLPPQQQAQLNALSPENRTKALRTLIAHVYQRMQQARQGQN